MYHTILLTCLLLQAPEANDATAAEPVIAEEKLSDSERMGKAKDNIAAMNSSLSAIIRHLKAARDEKDAVKLNCVNEKLTKVKGLLKISEQADVAMQEAMARKDNSSVAAEYAKITISQQKCAQLAADSETCVGELAVYSGADEVSVENNNESPYTEEQLLADSLAISVPTPERPVDASPYQ